MDYSFSRKIVSWYASHQRVLPWRGINDPYRIWVSEIILQQTRVAQGFSYYISFIEAFPSISDLAKASEDQILLLWQGLGYYSRARNMRQAAIQVMECYGGVFPHTYDGIRSLKGVGDYTAAAIASFAFHLPYAVLDGNVFRVLSRYFAIDTPIDTTKGKKLFASLAQELLDPSRAAEHNQGVMDLGATVCLPDSPCCDVCPLAESCESGLSGMWSTFPVKQKKVTVRNRYFVYIIIKNGESFYLHRRNEKDIWRGLYEFPLVELDEPYNDDAPRLYRSISDSLDFLFDGWSLDGVKGRMKHQLTHQTIHIVFMVGKGVVKKSEKERFVETRSLEGYAFPKPLERMVELIRME